MIELRSVPVNNGAIGDFRGTMDMDPEYTQKMVGVNVQGLIYMVQATVPYMPRGGRIVNISSAASKMGVSSTPLYAASKAAMDSLTYSWAGEVRLVRALCECNS